MSTLIPRFFVSNSPRCKVGQSKKGTDPMGVFLDATVPNFPVPHLQLDSGKNGVCKK